MNSTPVSLSLADLHAIVTDPAHAALVSTSDMVPTSGEGTAVAAPTYVVDKDNPNGPRIPLTPLSPQRKVFDDGTAAVITDPEKGLAVEASSVMLSNIGDQATRMENALWALRKELDLPGVVINAGDHEDRARLRATFDEQWGTIIKKSPAETSTRLKEIGPEAAWEGLITAMDLETGGVSSWTLAHRHVDGHIHSARPADAASDTETVWDGRSEVYTRLTSAGPGNLLDLLHFSPNSVLFGYWLSSGAPINHKVPRAMHSEIIGYGARQVAHGATKSSPWPENKGTLTDSKGKPLSGKKADPSTAGLGQIPVAVVTDSSALVTCTDIIATTTISLTLLRRHLRRGGMSLEQADAAATALVALGVLGRALTLEDGWLRSGCDLVDTSTVWEVLGRTGSQLVDLPITSREALTLAQDALAAAREVGAFGTHADSIFLTPSIKLAATVAGSYLPQLAGNSKESEQS